MKEIALIICIILATFLIVLAFKNENTLKNHLKIIDTIYRYHTDCIRQGIDPSVEYGDEEDYSTTLWRLWDWGYTRILPKDKFEIIKPYIK